VGSTRKAMGQACHPHDPGRAMPPEDLSHSGSASAGPSNTRYGPQLGAHSALRFCHAEFAECTQCNCGEKGGASCCCSNCEESFVQPRQGAVSVSQSSEPTLVLRPGHDVYRNQGAATFHTVVNPHVCAVGVLESPPPAGGSFLPPDGLLEEMSPRSCTQSWTTQSESGSEAWQFEPVCPVVITRRPPSVPPLALSGGVESGISSFLKWPLEAALSAASGKSNAISLGTTVCSSTSSGHQASGPPPLTLQLPAASKSCPNTWKAPKLSSPCAPALRKKAELSPNSDGEGLDWLDWLHGDVPCELPPYQDMPQYVDFSDAGYVEESELEEQVELLEQKVDRLRRIGGILGAGSVHDEDADDYLELATDKFLDEYLDAASSPDLAELRKEDTASLTNETASIRQESPDPLKESAKSAEEQHADERKAARKQSARFGGA